MRIIPLLFVLLVTFPAPAQDNVQRSTIYQIDQILKGEKTPAFYSLEGVVGYVCAGCSAPHIMVVQEYDDGISEELRAQSGLRLESGSVGVKGFEAGKGYMFLVQETRHGDGRVAARTITDFQELE